MAVLAVLLLSAIGKPDSVILYQLAGLGIPLRGLEITQGVNFEIP